MNANVEHGLTVVMHEDYAFFTDKGLLDVDMLNSRIGNIAELSYVRFKPGRNVNQGNSVIDIDLTANIVKYYGPVDNNLSTPIWTSQVKSIQMMKNSSGGKWRLITLFTDDQTPEIVNRTTIQKLYHLFATDDRLKKTRPIRSYQVDPAKVAEWNRLKEYGEDMKVVKITFDMLLQGISKCIEQIIYKLNDPNIKGLLLSTGLINNQAGQRIQSASEMWIYDMVTKVLKTYGLYKVEINASWTLITYLPDVPTVLPFKYSSNYPYLFLDDFSNSGTHISHRLYQTQYLHPEMGESPIIVMVGIAPSIFRMGDPGDHPSMESRGSLSAIINDLRMHEYQTNLTPSITNISGRTSLFVGMEFVAGDSDRLLFDHKSMENIDTDLYFGIYNFKGDSIGSLIEGWDPESPYQYPPALYHLIYGKGSLPLSVRPEIF